MAQIPSNEQVRKMQARTKIAVHKKKLAQKSVGKDFVLTGAGVVPEKIWQSHKEPKS